MMGRLERVHLRYNKPMLTRERERGAVSIFLVIFFALLIGVITISFIGIVIRNVTQSTNDDLSRSAYDSAQAGVEDAKRAIAKTLDACGTGSGQCATYMGYLNNQNCTTLPSFSGVLGLRTGSGHEVTVQNTDNEALDQAYTCVDITMNTPDYINSKLPYSSDLVPLTATAAFDGVTVNWYAHSDAPGMGDSDQFTPRTTGPETLPREADWDSAGQYTPALLRVQLISYSGTITDDQLAANTRTLFLYPTGYGAQTTSFDLDGVPPSAANAAPIIPVKCGGSGQFACSVNLGIGSNAGKTSLLRVTPVYKKTTFQLKLTGPGTPLFAGVQPIVDSTGRANDLFRRVEARVRMQNDVTLPEYAVDVQNSFCKDFSVGADPADFVNNCR